MLKTLSHYPISALLYCYSFIQKSLIHSLITDKVTAKKCQILFRFKYLKKCKFKTCLCQKDFLFINENLHPKFFKNSYI